LEQYSITLPNDDVAEAAISPLDNQIEASLSVLKNMKISIPSSEARANSSSSIRTNKTSSKVLGPLENPSGKRSSLRSLRSLAVRHHSRQENIYIPSDDVISVARGPDILSSLGPQEFAVKQMSFARRISDSFTFTISPPNTERNPSSGTEINSLPPIEESFEAKAIVALQPSPHKFKPDLKIKIQDDFDWIQVC
jgi:hypothetical protein